jgi:hypothetical protein
VEAAILDRLDRMGDLDQLGGGGVAHHRANGSKTHCAGFCAGGNRFYPR